MYVRTYACMHARMHTHTHLHDPIREVQDNGRACPEPSPEVREADPFLYRPLPSSPPCLQQVLGHVGTEVLQESHLYQRNKRKCEQVRTCPISTVAQTPMYIRTYDARELMHEFVCSKHVFSSHVHTSDSVLITWGIEVNLTQVTVFSSHGALR